VQVLSCAGNQDVCNCRRGIHVLVDVVLERRTFAYMQSWWDDVRVIALSGVWGNEEGVGIFACRERVAAGRRKVVIRTISCDWRARLGGLRPHRGICINVSKTERLPSKTDMGKCLCDEKLTCHMRRLYCSKRTCKRFTSADIYMVHHQIEACKSMYAVSAPGFLQINIPEPTIRFSVMSAAATAGKLCAGDDTQIFLGLHARFG
jgi:hypothetical protein